MGEGYCSEDGLGFIPLTISALILGAILHMPTVRAPVSCVTVTGIGAAPMIDGRQQFDYYEMEVCGD